MTLSPFLSSYNLLSLYPPPPAGSAPVYIQTTCQLPSQSVFYSPLVLFLFSSILVSKLATTFRFKRTSSGARSNGLPLPSQSHRRSLSQSIFSSRHNEIFDTEEDESCHPSLVDNAGSLSTNRTRSHVRRVSRVWTWKEESDGWAKGSLIVYRYRIVRLFLETGNDVFKLLAPGIICFIACFAWFSLI